MKKLRIGVDIDNVIAQFVPAYLERHNKKHRTNFTIYDIKSYYLCDWLNIPEEEIVKNIFEMQVGGEYMLLKPVPNVSKYINILKEKGHEIILITNRVNADDTILWLKIQNVHFDKLFTIKSKSWILDLLHLDYYIEDNPNNAYTANKKGIKTIIFNQPWNRMVKETDTMKRAKNWKQVIKIIEDD